MQEKEKSMKAVKEADGKRKEKNQNQRHNSKKEALGPNTKR